MTETIIRQLEGEEIFETLISLDAYAFDSTPPLPKREEWDKWMTFCTDATFMALFENGKAVATAVSSPMTQNVRGKIYPMSGLWAVATNPMARRKGYAWRRIVQLAAPMDVVDRVGARVACIAGAVRPYLADQIDGCRAALGHVDQIGPIA